MKGFYITNLDKDKQGGLFHATYERLKRHAKHLNEITIINNNYHLKDEESYVFEDLKIYNMNYKRSLGYIIDKFFRNKQERKLIKSYVSKFDILLTKADFIHAHWGWPNGYIAYRLAEKYSVPYFITFHGNDINNIKKRNLGNMLEAMEGARYCFFVSNALLNAAIKKGYSGDNAVVNYNGVDMNQFKEATKVKTIGYVGTLHRKKGADLLPKIFKKINNNSPEINFKIIGEGPLEIKLRKEVKELGLENKVEFLGELPKESTAKVMSELCLLVVPSRKEGLGMVILEANACGVPVVGSNSGGIPEAIGNKKNHFPLDNDFIENISGRAINIIKNGDYEKNSLELRKRIQYSFTWEKCVKLEFESYKNAVNS